MTPVPSPKRLSGRTAILALFAAFALVWSAVTLARTLDLGSSVISLAIAVAVVGVLWLVVGRIGPFRAGSTAATRLDSAGDFRRLAIWLAVSAPFVVAIFVVGSPRFALAIASAGFLASAFFDQLVVASRPRLSGRPPYPPQWRFLAVVVAICAALSVYGYATG